MKDEPTKNFSLFFKAAKLKIYYELVLLTPAREIKKWKLKQIIKELKILRNEQEEEDKKEMEFIAGNPKAKVNYKVVGVTDSKKEK
ncbi:hypothetical protein KA005_17185 [bacterium]|nr:hypothetical protein [bacterium]